MFGVCKRLIFIVVLSLMATSALAQDYTGWWWDPNNSGTGYSLQVQNVEGKSYDVAYMLWYLYDQSGLNTWYASIMKVTGNTMTGDLAEYDGWPLEPGVVSDVVPADIGEFTMTFTDANTGTISYTINGNNYSRPLQRWEQNGTQDPRNLLGWWWDSSKNGVGWFLEARNNRFFIGWYNYRAEPTRTGGMPRWYIALDQAFATDQTAFTQPLGDYSGGQTATGPYQAPSVQIENPAENFQFTLPAGAAPNSIALTYEGNSFNLTRFTIPDIFTENPNTCAPEKVVVSPAQGETSTTLRPTIMAKVKTPCGTAIDNSSIVMKVNNVVVQHTVTNATPDQADIRYTPTEMLATFSDHFVHVEVSDVGGSKGILDWSFYIGESPY